MQEMQNVLNSLTDEELENIILRETEKVADLSETISLEDDFLVESNSPIDEAKFIFIGEIHDNHQNILKNQALINKVLLRGKDNPEKKVDIVFFEGLDDVGEMPFSDTFLVPLLSSYFYELYHWDYSVEENSYLSGEILDRTKYIFKDIRKRQTPRGKELSKKVQANGYRLISHIWGTGWDLIGPNKNILKRNHAMVETLKEHEIYPKSKKLYMPWYNEKINYNINRFFIIAGSLHLPRGEYEKFNHGESQRDFFNPKHSTAETLEIYNFLKQNNRKYMQIISKEHL